MPTMMRNAQEGMSQRTTPALLIVTFVASIAALLVAPALMPESYSLLLHGTSESGAQGVEGAWMARLGFLLFGLAALWLAGVARPRWGRWASLAHGWFGVWMIAVAAFSTRSWVAGASFDPTEDLLHTIGASAMGIGFMAGVALAALHRSRTGGRVQWLDRIAFLTALLMPPLMAVTPEYYGILQRVMFGVAYTWYISEAIRLLAPPTTRVVRSTVERARDHARGSTGDLTS